MPFHPQTQGKIERWHQTLKNRILLENYFLPGDLERQIAAFVEHYNHRRYHESLNNVTPADAYFGRAEAIIQLRERIKRKTIEHRRLQHRKLAAYINPDEANTPLIYAPLGAKCSDDGQPKIWTLGEQDGRELDSGIEGNDLPWPLRRLPEIKCEWAGRALFQQKLGGNITKANQNHSLIETKR